MSQRDPALPRREDRPLLPKDTAAKYEAIEWMMVQMTTLGPMFGQHVHFIRFAPKGNDYSQSRYTTQVHRVLEVMDQRLAGEALAGRRRLQYRRHRHLSWARNIPVMLGAAAAEKYKNVMRWVGVISERPAVKRRLPRSMTCGRRPRSSTRRRPTTSTGCSVRAEHSASVRHLGFRDVSAPRRRRPSRPISTAATIASSSAHPMTKNVSP